VADMISNPPSVSFVRILNPFRRLQIIVRLKISNSDR
jgi:hypothetical protein